MNVTTYVKKVVLNEIKKSTNANLVNNIEDIGVYVLYIWIACLDSFQFKVGETKNITKRIIELNRKYESDNKVILVFYGKNYIDKIFHNRLKRFNKKGTSSRELYNISPSCYDQIKYIFEWKPNNYFECKEYEIKDDGTEYIKLANSDVYHYDDHEITTTYDDHNLEDNNKKFIELNSYNTIKYWKVKTRNVRRYKEDDGRADQDDNDDKDSENEIDVDTDFNPNDESDDESDNESNDKSNDEMDLNTDEEPEFDSSESDSDSDESSN
jgi:hypothetical protein